MLNQRQRSSDCHRYCTSSSWAPTNRSQLARLTAAQFESLPATLQVREPRYHLGGGRGRRTRVVNVATTLLDPLKYPNAKLCELYGLRWSVETHCLKLKTTPKMRRVKSLPRGQPGAQLLGVKKVMSPVRLPEARRRTPLGTYTWPTKAYDVGLR